MLESNSNSSDSSTAASTNVVRCRVDAQNEANKLAAKENDWQLAGGVLATRTRRGGVRTPNIYTARNRNDNGRVVSPIIATDINNNISTAIDGGNGGSTTDANNNSPTNIINDTNSNNRRVTIVPPTDTINVVNGFSKKKEKPVSRTVLLQVDQIVDLFKCLGCPDCGGKLVPTIHTICIVSRIELQCEDCCFDTTDGTDAMDTSDGCSFGYDNDLRAKTTIHANDTRIARSTDYAVNVMYVLGFLSSGDGGTEAGRLLAMLGLPNSTTMATTSFPTIENRIGQAIRDLGKEIVRENLIAEVRKGMVEWNKATFDKWKSSLTDPEAKLDKEEYAVIQASYV